MIRYQLYKENEGEMSNESPGLASPSKGVRAKAAVVKQNKRSLNQKAAAKHAGNNRMSPKSFVRKTKTAKSIYKKIEKGQKEMRESEIIHWVQCEACYKWRRLPEGYSKQAVKKKFLCNYSKGNTCETSEESWRRHYTTISTD